MTSIDTIVPRHAGSRRFTTSLAVASALALIAACSSSNNSGSDAASTCAMPGGDVAGPADTHCMMNNMAVVQATDVGSCYPDAAPPGDDASSGDDASVVVEAGGGPTGDCFPNEYGPTMYGTAGGDDDCKYDVTWSSTAVCEGGNGVYFTLTVHRRTDHGAVTGADPYIEAVKDCVTPAANVPPPATDLGGGTYKIGPIVFPVSGKWVIRFHIFGDNCSDVLPTSPHGHAAFFLNVP